MNNSIELRTERLLLRPVQASDAEATFSYRSDSETNKYQGWIPETIEDVSLFLSKVSSEFDVPETWFQFVLIDLETTEIIGDLGIHFLDEKQTELGCTLAQKQHGKGYATEALEATVNYLFHDCQKHRIVGSIDPGNIKSIKLIERLGFRKEAHFVESLFLNDRWVDDVVYALLKKEWKQAR